MTSGATSRATCRGTRTRGEDKVVDDDERCGKPHDEPRDVSRHPTRGEDEVIDDEPARGGVVDDERRDKPRNEPRDVPRHPDAR
jgi:hypothetical protein